MQITTPQKRIQLFSSYNALINWSRKNPFCPICDGPQGIGKLCQTHSAKWMDSAVYKTAPATMGMEDIYLEFIIGELEEMCVYTCASCNQQFTNRDEDYLCKDCR
jgi:hypothetical protein